MSLDRPGGLVESGDDLVGGPVGCADRSSAATPDTTGAANEHPSAVPYPPSQNGTGMSSAGPMRSTAVPGAVDVSRTAPDFASPPTPTTPGTVAGDHA